ncbi:MAG: alpha-1,2-fucosyltransferase, partial [Paludibacteraceae bacterium]|nr:alpha-1,2-fucosyltransferase [Paludibacteraceae bacterium]
PDTKIDASIYRYRPSHNGYELERIFAIHPEHATIAERNQMVDIGKDLFSEIRRALGWKKRTTGQLVIEPDPAQGWCPELLHADNCYLQGYWQSEKYFAEVKEQVRQDFQFCLPLSPEDEQWAKQIQNSNSVSVHIRRGDYLKKRRVEDYNVCSVSYYRSAVKTIQAQVEHPVFYVFSDEPEWGKAQEIFPEGTIFVSGHTGEKAYIDMQLMSLCRHHIIANSSFSWWGAWLGQQEETITIAPDTWFRNRPRPDIIPQEWTTIDAN